MRSIVTIVSLRKIRNLSHSLARISGLDICFCQCDGKISVSPSLSNAQTPGQSLQVCPVQSKAFGRLSPVAAVFIEGRDDHPALAGVHCLA